MNKIISGICVLVLLSFATSCSLLKKSTRKQTNTVVTDSTKIAVTDTSKASIAKVQDSVITLTDSVKSIAGNVVNPAPGNPELIAGMLPLWNRHTDYTTFNGKAKVHLETPNDKQDFTATIRIEKDKKIWVSIVALGVFEAARALITPDTIILLDRLHKEVTIVPFKDAGRLLPVNVDFAALQGLLIGDALHASADMPTNVTLTGDAMLLDINTKDYQQQVTYNNTDSSIRQQQLKLTGNNTTSGTLLLMQYSNYGIADNRRFAESRVIDADDPKGGHTHVEMQFNKAEFDQPLEFNISIPDRYTRKSLPENIASKAPVDSVKTPTEQPVAQPPAANEKQQLIEGMLPLWNRHTDYKTFTGKAKVHLESPKDKRDLTITIRMEKDKKVWVSVVAHVPIIGAYEAMQAMITPDTIILVDRYHKEVTLRSFKDAGKILPINVPFSALQEMLIGDALHADGTMPTDATAIADTLLLNIITKEYQQQLAYNKADSTIRKQQMKVQGTDSVAGADLMMQYDNYTATDNRNMANHRLIDVDDAKGHTHVDMQFEKIEFDQPMDITISVPEKYKKK